MTMENTLRANHDLRADGIRLVPLITAQVLRRAAIIALVLGSVLTLANQFGAIFGDDHMQFLPLGLVYLTPFVVVTISQCLGMRQALTEAEYNGRGDAPRSGVVTTALSHGIPQRALLVSLIVGGVNTAIVAIVALIDGSNLASLPISPIGQAFILPLLFGLVSQSFAYRRQAELRAASF